MDDRADDDLGNFAGHDLATEAELRQKEKEARKRKKKKEKKRRERETEAAPRPSTTPKSEDVYLLLLVKVSSAPTRCARRSMPLPPPARAHSVRLSHAW